MKKIWGWFKSLHWIARAAIIAAFLIVVGILGAYYVYGGAEDHGPKLADYKEVELEVFLKEETKLDIRVVELDKAKGFVSVYYFDDNAHDENSIVYILSRDSALIMPLMFNLAGTKKVKVTELGTFVNGEGNSSVEPSASITISKAKADEIKWEEINSTNMAGLISQASELYIHPIVRAEISNEDILKAIITQLSTN